MILVAYGCLVVVLGAVLIRGAVFIRTRRSELLARLVGMIGATATASIALLLLSTRRPTTLGLTVLLMVLSGSIIYLSGLALWHARPGFALRLIGWSLIVAALVIPSTLTLLLPLAALLTLALSAASADRTLAVRQTSH
jgi:hypothetical protein